MRKRERLESVIQAEIQREIGAEPDLILLRNSQGQAHYVNETTGKEYRVPYGLGDGTPDLVGLLRRKLFVTTVRPNPDVPQYRDDILESIQPITIATWFCLEVKAPGGEPSPAQLKVAQLWRRFGAFVEFVDSAVNARAALERARKGLPS